MAVAMKSAKCMSTTGRAPQSAAPTAAPTIEVSEIGVSSTRWAPNSSGRPLNCPKTPPWSAMSSPMAKTSESRRISSRIAAMVASVNVRTDIRLFPPVQGAGVQVLQRLLRLRQRALPPEAHRRRKLLLDLGPEARQCVGVQDALVEQAPLQPEKRVVRLP